MLPSIIVIAKFTCANFMVLENLNSALDFNSSADLKKKKKLH